MVRTAAIAILGTLILVPTAVLAQGNSVSLNATISERSERCSGGDYLLYSCSAGEHRAALAVVARRDLLKKVGNLIADNKCDEARSAALRDGDFDLAQQVNAFCKVPNAALPQQ